MRGWGKTCVVGAEACIINYEAKTLTIGETVINEGDWISINGTTGEIILGQCETSEPELTDEFFAVMSWTDSIRRLRVRANCETPEDAKRAREYGAEGIGLFRTEHMFYGEARVDELYLMKKMILSTSVAEKAEALDALKPAFKKSFKGTFIEMDGLPVTTRLLDPPQHEFASFSTPINEIEAGVQMRLKQKLCTDLSITLTELQRRIDSLHEANPGSGFRGSRLGVVFPDITRIQVEAMLETVIELRTEGYNPILEIEVPFVINSEEYEDQRAIILNIAENLRLVEGVDFLTGAMLENMSACFDADRIAQTANFGTFGTNDLTASLLNASRDDASRFLAVFLEKKILKIDPFQTLHPVTIRAMEIAIGGMRRVKGHNMEIGICGEQGGDPVSIMSCERLGLDYVSCSPFRVPVARLAAAQATIALEREKAAAMQNN